jgi:flagellar biosynthetic protein FlhB
VRAEGARFVEAQNRALRTMAEDQAQERTLPATPRRLEKAREEGRVPRSTELATMTALLTASASLWWGGGALIERLGTLLDTGLRIGRREAFDGAFVGARLGQLALDGVIAAAPVLAALVVAAAAAPLAIGGWNLSWRAVQPQFSRLDPLAGLQRLFSLHGLAELAKALAKALLLAGAAGWLIWTHRDAAAGLAMQSVRPALVSAAGILLASFAVLAACSALVAVFDVPLQLHRYRSSLRMSLTDLREESRETEGDPQLRARIRSLQRDMARRRMMSEVPKADVVVTNPTHYAVALAYRDGSAAAPKVVAKGAGHLAARIRELAAQHGVPLLEAPPLARALYRHAEIGEEIPRALYAAVAQVLAWVFQVRRQRSFGGRAPVPPQDLPVPQAMDFVPEADA